MTFFTVTEVADWHTLVLSPGWVWQGQRGSRIRPAGFDVARLDEPKLGNQAGAEATQGVQKLLQGKVVMLGSAYRIDRGRLVCEVYFDGHLLPSYFPHHSA